MASDHRNATDTELVNQTRKGITSAYGELYDRYFKQLYRYIYFRVQNQEEAEDLTEIVFLKTLESIRHRRAAIDNFQGWLFRTAHNLVIDHYRTERSQVSIENIAELRDSQKLPEKQVQHQFDSVELAKAIATLSPEFQQVIVCRFISGMSHAETSKIMGVNQGYLRVLQFRALKQLRNVLKREFDYHD
ncbi:MAG: RNA polymerase sigma factor [Anaerolineales bacterium]